MLEEHKVQGDFQRKQTDDFNLQLQSYLYEKSYYTKEIHACRETKTPNLDKVVKKAVERNGNKNSTLLDENLKKLLSINQTGVSEEIFKELSDYLDKNLNERKELAG